MEKKQSLLIKTAPAFLILLFFIGCSNKDEVVFKLNIGGLGNQVAIFQEQRVNGAKMLDTLEFNSKGKITYKAQPRQPTFYNVKIPVSSDLFFLAYPGDRINVTASSLGEITDLQIEGSDESVLLNELYDSLFAAREILKQIRLDYQNTSHTEEREILLNEYEDLLKGYRKYSMQYVLDNLQSLCSIAALYQEIGPSEFVFGRKRDLQFFKLVTDSLNKYFPKHRHVQALTRNFSGMIESMQLEKLLSQAEEVKAGLPSLELPSMEGKIVSLNELNKKYVLLNFYNEADGSISKIFPQLNRVHSNYSSKGFDIYNVYLGKSTENWQRIVKFEEITNWTNVADTSFPYSQSLVAYNVQAIPSNYLLDLETKSVLLKDISPVRLNQILSNLVKQ